MAYSVKRALGTIEVGKHPRPAHEDPMAFFTDLCLEHLHPAEVLPVLNWFDAVKSADQEMFTEDAVLALGVAFAVAEGLRKPEAVLKRPPTWGEHFCALFEGRLLFQELNTRETIVSVLYKPPPKGTKDKVTSPPMDSKLMTQYGTTLERAVSRLSSGGAVSEGGEPRDATPREVVHDEDEHRPMLHAS